MNASAEKVYELNGYLKSLECMGNYSFEFFQLNSSDTLSTESSYSKQTDLQEIANKFNLWLLNSLHDYFSDDFNYTPVLEQHHWKNKHGYEVKKKIIQDKWCDILDILVNEIIDKNNYKIVTTIGRSVISDTYLIIADSCNYVLSLG